MSGKYTVEALRERARNGTLPERKAASRALRRRQEYKARRVEAHTSSIKRKRDFEFLNVDEIHYLANPFRNSGLVGTIFPELAEARKVAK